MGTTRWMVEPSTSHPPSRIASAEENYTDEEFQFLSAGFMVWGFGGDVLDEADEEDHPPSSKQDR